MTFPFAVAGPVLRLLTAPVTTILGWAIVLTMLGPDQVMAQDQRRFTVNDLFELESTGRYYGGAYAFSPDGDHLAFTRVRPKKTLRNHKWDYLRGNAGGDIWVQFDFESEPVNVTGGVEDGSGWWSPQWSPDGNYLAMLSTRGGGVQPWIWEVQTKRLRRLTDRSVELGGVEEHPYAWVDADRILVPLLPEGELPEEMTVELRTPTIATSAWEKVPEGREVTASVLESGVPVDLSARPHAQLVLIDVSDGTSRVVVDGDTRSWRLAPDGRTLAFTQQLTRYVPQADQELPHRTRLEESGIGVMSLDGRSVSFDAELSRDVLEESLRWSPDGERLAFFGYEGGRDTPLLLYRLDIRELTVTKERLPDVNPSPIVHEQARLEWTADGGLFLRARRAGDDASSTRARQDWWYVPSNGPPRNLTLDLKEPPREMWPQEGRVAFAGVGGGELWRITPSLGRVENLTRDFQPEVFGIRWPSVSPAGDDQYPVPGATYDQVVLSVQEDDQTIYSRVDLRTGRMQEIQAPVPGADLVAYGPGSQTAILSSTDRSGLRIWRTRVGSGTSSVLVDGNTFLRNITEGQLKPVEYTSLNGEALNAWLVLPTGYEPGKRYPMLTWVYAGAVYNRQPPSSSRVSINSASFLNMQIPAARGYAVLLPSMPLAPDGETDDPMLRLPEGVLPAVDAAVELGIADPERLFLGGHSFGGYSTYGLISQTHRFRAAVALAGISNLISLYGQFDARRRYTDYPHESLFAMTWMESSQALMGSPPWKDLGRYIRNSPIFFADRVKTPLMIIQGDMDYIALQQGEEFFMSLYRQGKRAKFVRYWGEGHILESPANIRDMWERIFDWFDAYSQEEP